MSRHQGQLRPGHRIIGVVGHHSYSFQRDSNMNTEEAEYMPIGFVAFVRIEIFEFICVARHTLM